MRNILFLLCLSFLTSTSFAQLTVDNSLSDVDLIQTLAGPGLTITNVTINCPDGAYGFYDATTTSLGSSSGVLLTTGEIDNAVGPNNSASAGTDNFAAGDSDLNLITSPTNDACIVEFDLETIGDSLTFNYIFASEEYPEFAPPNNSGFNDVFAFFISGPGITGQQNIALVPGTTTPVSINNVNPVTNAAFFVNNTTGAGDAANIQYDGYTTNLQAVVANLQPCEVYSLKLAIADGFDGIYDSGVFLEAGSFVSSAVAVAASSIVDNQFIFAVEGCVDAEFTFTLPETSLVDSEIEFTVGGTATNGVDYGTLPSSIIIPAGSLQSTLSINVLADALDENVETLTLYLNSPCNPIPYDSASLDIYDADAYGLNATSQGFSGCIGSDATLFSSNEGFINHEWTPSTYLTSTNNDIVEAQNIIDDITYFITADLGTCTLTDSVELDVSPSYGTSLADTDTTCEGGITTLSAGAIPSSVNIVSYAWSPSEFLIDSTTQSVVAAPPTTTDYFVEMVSDLGCIINDTITVVVTPGGLSVNIEPNDTAICPGESINLNAEASLQCEYTLDMFDSFGDGWSGGSIEVEINGNGIGDFAAEGAGTQGFFTVPNGENFSLNYTSGALEGDNSYDLLDAGGNVLFSDGPFPSTGNVFTQTASCGISNPSYTYEWIEGENLSATTGDNVVATPTLSSTYTVVADDGVCNGVSSITVNVVSPPYEAQDDTICFGELGQLNAVFTGDSLYSCEYTLDMFDSFGDGWTGGSISVEVDGISAGDFSAVGDGSQGTFLVETGQTYTLSYTAGSLEFDNEYDLLDPQGNVLFSDGPSPSTGLVFTGTNTSNVGCTALFPDITFDWTANSALSDNSILNPTADVNSTTEFYFNSTNNDFGCDFVDTATVYVFGDPTGITITPDSAICEGENIQLEVTGAVGTDIVYSWTPSSSLDDTTIFNPTATPLNTTEYRVDINLDGCPVEDSVTITVNPTPFVLINDGQSPVAICESDSILLIATDVPTYEYQWENTSNNTNSLSVGQGGSYTLIVSEGLCSNSFSIEVVSDGLPSLNLDDVPNILCCNIDDEIIFNPYTLPTGAAIDSFFWEQNFEPQDVTIIEDGTFEYRIVDENGCENTESFIVERNCLNPEIVAEDTLFDSQEDTVSVLFTDVGQGTNSYSWSPSGLFNDSNLSNPIFSSTVIGDNLIQLDLSTTYIFGTGTEKTCVEVATDEIHILENSSFEMPDAFTPNGDGVNDIFQPILNGANTLITFAIYNQWGEIVYRYDGTGTGWDGTYNGELQPQATYMYFITVELADGTIANETGVVDLIY